MALVKFDIPPRARRCNSCNKDFSQGMEYISVLDQINDEGFGRQDYCVPCWKKLRDESLDTIAGKVHWKSAVPIKPQGSESALRRDEKAMELLRDILQDEDEEEIPEAFVLALLLARSKRLQLKQEIVQEEGTILLYEVAGTEEMLAIRKVSLSNIQTEKVQNIIAKRLNNPFGITSELTPEVSSEETP
jgi:hypothetical protein